MSKALSGWDPFFTMAELGRYLSFLKTVAPVVPLRDYGKRNIVLRFDVDMDFQPAYDVFKLLKEKKMRASFFVLLSSPSYNPQSRDARRMLREMALSQEVGLHFDPTVYGKASQAKLQSEVEKEARLLASITGKEVSSVTLHNPSVSGKYPRFKGFINGYDENVFEDARYLSDSMRVDRRQHPFRGKDPYAFVKQARKFPLQIVLHPEQFAVNGGDFKDIIAQRERRMADESIKEIEAILRAVKA